MIDVMIDYQAVMCMGDGRTGDSFGGNGRSGRRGRLDLVSS